jgi:hypothetical protein
LEINSTLGIRRGLLARRAEILLRFVLALPFEYVTSSAAEGHLDGLPRLIVKRTASPYPDHRQIETGNFFMSRESEHLCRRILTTIRARRATVGAFLAAAVLQAQGVALGMAPASNSGLRCSAPRLVAEARLAGSPAINVSFNGDEKARTFKMGSAFTIRFDATTSAPDLMDWQIKDYAGAVVSSGVLRLPGGGASAEIQCSSDTAGYFAVFAQLKDSGATIPSEGSRPAGFASFGVLPDYSHLLPAGPSGPLDRRRFGLQGTNYLESGKCCDGNGLQPINELLGSTWVLDARHQGKTEPKHSGQYDPATYPLDVGFKQGTLARIVTLNGIPAWASTAPTPTAGSSYPPKSFDAFQSYTALVGRETESVRRRFIPDQQKNYYQVTWEPDPGPPTHWLGSDSEFVALYKAAWQGLHSTDPNAVVMGPATSGLGACGEWLNRLSPLGFTRYIDAVACHGYYTLGASSAKPPEAADLPGQMQALRKTIAALLPPATKLFITETGIAYPMGSKYSSTYPTADVLIQHAEAVVRTHLIFLGEGADVSFLFYSADYAYEVGFGLYFNLSMPDPSFGSPNISPKPAAMAVTAMTRLLGDSRTLGALKMMPGGTYGYSFLLPDGSHAVTALWAHNGSFDAHETFGLQVDVPGSRGTVVVLDAVGNLTATQYADGRVRTTLSEMPIYVLSANIGALRPQLRTPEGYATEP